jgi:hypothetical protein
MDELIYLTGLIYRDVEKANTRSERRFEGNINIGKIIIGPKKEDDLEFEEMNFAPRFKGGLLENMAVAEVGITYGQRTGHGELYILEKKDGDWQVKDRQTTWLS